VANLVKRLVQASLGLLVHREQFQLLQTLKFLPLKTSNFQILRAKAKWQARKLLMRR
jgi:hypothetical protein